VRQIGYLPKIMILALHFRHLRDLRTFNSSLASSVGALFRREYI